MHEQTRGGLRNWVNFVETRSYNSALNCNGIR